MGGVGRGLVLIIYLKYSESNGEKTNKEEKLYLLNDEIHFTGKYKVRKYSRWYIKTELRKEILCHVGIVITIFRHQFNHFHFLCELLDISTNFYFRVTGHSSTTLPYF